MNQLLKLLQFNRFDTLYHHNGQCGLYGLSIVTSYLDLPRGYDVSIVYPVTANLCRFFSHRSGFTDSRAGRPGTVALPDTIETRYAYWYVTYIDNDILFDIRDIPDDLIALLVHARDTGETWALEDYLTEAGVL